VGTGFHVGANFNFNSHMLGQTETFGATGVVTNQFSDFNQALGVGFNAGYLFPVGNNGILQAGPFVSFDYLNQDTNHSLAGGFFLGNTINSITTVGATVGVAVTPQIFLYTDFGASWVDRDQKLNFLGRTTAVNASAPGVTVGGGVEFHPSDWLVSMIFEVDHTFVQKTSVSNPDSPGFIYGNDSNINRVKAGIRVPLDFGIRGPYGIW
jgi:opacity protein-like surface antigen